MAKIAILGFGTVGSGVYEVLCHNAASVSRRAGEPVRCKAFWPASAPQAPVL